jgi:hypothetical protein
MFSLVVEENVEHSFGGGRSASLMAKQKQSRFGGRMDPALRARLDRIHARYLTNDSGVIHELLTAFCDSVEEADAVRWPAVVLLAEKQVLRAAEDPPDKRPLKHGAGPNADVRKPA